MGFVIELKGIGQFILRRLKIILLTFFVILGGFIIVNLLTQEEVVSTDKTQPVIGEKYTASFEILAENPITGGSMMNVSTIFKMLTDTDIQKNMEAAGIEVPPASLSKYLKVSSRENQGEILTVQVTDENEEKVKEGIDFFYNVINEKKAPFFADKKFYIVSPPTDVVKLSTVKAPKELSSSSGISDSETKDKPVAATKQNDSSQYVVVIIVGLISSIFVALIVDIFDKKIHAISYIQSIVPDTVNVINSVNQSEKSSLMKMLLTTLSTNNNILYLNEKEDTTLNAKIEEAYASENITDEMKAKVAFDNALTIHNANDVDTVILFCKKDATSIKWLKEQAELAILTGKTIEIFYYK